MVNGTKSEEEFIEVVTQDGTPVSDFLGINNKTGDIYYKVNKAGLWRNRKQIISIKGRYSLNFQDDGIFVSVMEDVTVYNPRNKTSNNRFSLYEIRTEIKKIQTVSIDEKSDCYDHMWIRFKKLNIVATISRKGIGACDPILNLYACHKKLESTLIQTFDFTGIFGAFYKCDIKMITGKKKNTLDIVYTIDVDDIDDIDPQFRPYYLNDI